MKKVILGLLIVIAPSLFTSCIPFMNNQRGNLVITIKEYSDTRAVYPFAEELANVDHYTVTLLSPSGMEETLDNVKETSIERTYIEAGIWKVDVIAYNASGNVLGRGSASTEVKAASATRITLSIYPSGDGRLIAEISWLNNNLVNEEMRIEAALLPEGQTSYLPIILAAGNKSVSYVGDLSSGTYNLMAQLKDSENRVLWGYIETYHLYEDLDTINAIEILPEDMNAAPEAAPEILKVERGHDRIMLVWSEGSPRTERYVLQRMVSAGEWSDLSVVQYGTLSFTDYNLTSSTKYTYRLRAENSFGDSVWSENVEIMTMPVVDVRAVLLQDTVWTSDSVYKIRQNFRIPSGLSLRIMPGTKIIIDPGVFIQIQGELIARGEKDNPIIFGYASQGWTYLGFVADSKDANFINGQYQTGSILQHVKIRGGGRIAVDQCYPYLDNIDIDSATDHSISITLDGDFSKTISVTNCQITNVQNTGIVISGSGRLIINSNYISGNTGIRVDGGDRFGTIISNNTMYVNNDGICINPSQNASLDELFVIRRNIIRSPNQYSKNGSGIYLGNWGNLNGISILENSIEDKSVGIFFDNHYSVNLDISNNLINNCVKCLVLSSEGWSTQDIKIKYNILTNSSDIGIEYNHAKRGAIPFVQNYIDNPNAQYDVRIGDRLKINGALALDLSNNYWASADEETIKARIYDTEKNFEIGMVNIEPIGVLQDILAKPTYPATNSIERISAVDFGWLILGRAKSVRLQIAGDSSFTEILSDKIVIGSSYRLGLDSVAWLSDGKTYYWRIAAKSEDGIVHTWSEVKYFRVSMLIPLPTSPLNGDTLYDDISPELSWIPSYGAAGYRLAVDDNADFISPILDTKIWDGTAYEFNQDLEPGTIYYWKVSAIDKNGTESSPSAIQTFILPQPGIIVRVSPDIPLPQDIRISCPPSATASTTVQVSCTSKEQMQRYVWTINGEKVAETYTPSVSLNLGSRSSGFYSLGVTGWLKGYSYSDSKAFQITSQNGAMP